MFLVGVFLDQAGEARKEQVRVVGAGAGLRVILHAEDRAVGQAQPFHRAVVEVAVGDLHVGGQRILLDRVVMVLRGDLHVGRAYVAHRLVAAVVPKLELIGAAAQRQTDNLVAQTDAKGGDAGGEQAADRGRGIGHARRVAGAVAEEDAVWVERKYILGGGVGRDDGHAQAVAGQPAQDVVLDAEVIGDDQGGILDRGLGRAQRGRAFLHVATGGNGSPLHACAIHPVIGLLAGDFLDQVAAVQPSPAARQFQQLRCAFAAVGAERSM